MAHFEGKFVLTEEESDELPDSVQVFSGSTIVQGYMMHVLVGNFGPTSIFISPFYSSSKAVNYSQEVIVDEAPDGIGPRIVAEYTRILRQKLIPQLGWGSSTP